MYLFISVIGMIFTSGLQPWLGEKSSMGVLIWVISFYLVITIIIIIIIIIIFYFYFSSTSTSQWEAAQGPWYARSLALKAQEPHFIILIL